jgi:hypothetical protein
MKRRDFIILVGGMSSWLLVARAAAESAGKQVPKIGVLVAGSPDPQPFWKIFRQALHDLGYVEPKISNSNFGRLRAIEVC